MSGLKSLQRLKKTLGFLKKGKRMKMKKKQAKRRKRQLIMNLTCRN